MIKHRREEERKTLKDFVIGVGRVLIDFSCAISFLVVILATIFGIKNNEPYSILVFIIGIIVVVSVYYLIYLLIDIRDLLKKMADD